MGMGDGATMRHLPFAKLHGLGNDYVYADAAGVEVCGIAVHDLARFVSDRHFGVGSDGLIVVGPGAGGDRGDLTMRMFNADGSESAMCGNGVRCATRFGVERRMSTANPLTMATGKCLVMVEWFRDERGSIDRASVDMGRPVLACSGIPAVVAGVAPDARVVAHPIVAEEWDRLGLAGEWQDACGLESAMTLVSMGNPHAVFFCDDAKAVPLERVGAVLERSPWFPERANVHFVQVLKTGLDGNGRAHVRMRTWERGSGITMACGSGACAVAVAGALEARTARLVSADLPGGTLSIEWRDDDHVIMEGPCTAVYEGALDLSAIQDWRRVRGPGA